MSKNFSCGEFIHYSFPLLATNIFIYLVLNQIILRHILSKIKLSKERSEINVSKGKKKNANFYLRWLEHRCLFKHLYSLYEIPFYYEIIHSDVEEDDVSNKDMNLVYFDITCYLAILSLSVKAIKTCSIIILRKSAWS